MFPLLTVNLKKADGLTAYLQMTYPFINAYSLETMSVHDLNQNRATHLVFIIPAKKNALSPFETLIPWS